MSMVQRVAEVLNTVFGKVPELANNEIKVIVRERKFSATTLAQSFILALFKNPHAKSLEIAEMAGLLGVDVTPEAVEQRYSPTFTQFFRKMFELMSKEVIHSDKELAPLLSRFTEVRIIDSSVVGLPASMANEFPGCGGTNGCNAAAVKLQTELDLRTGGLTCVQLEPGKSPDQATDRLKVTPTAGSLQLADMGYFSIAKFQRIAAAGAYFLSRIQHIVLIEVDGKVQRVTDFLRGQSSNLIDTVVRLGKENPFECRLIAWRVPARIAKQRRNQLIKRLQKKGRKPTASALEACNWNFLTTNLDADQLSVEEAIVLYRARWQIELLFKRWKSHCGIDLLDGRTDAITMARFWIRLCAAILQQWLVGFAGWTDAPRVPSFSKVAAAARNIVDALALAITDTDQIERCLERFQKLTQKLCRRTTRLKKPTFIQLIRDPSQLEYSLT